MVAPPLLKILLWLPSTLGKKSKLINLSFQALSSGSQASAFTEISRGACLRNEESGALTPGILIYTVWNGAEEARVLTRTKARGSAAPLSSCS